MVENPEEQDDVVVFPRQMRLTVEIDRVTIDVQPKFVGERVAPTKPFMFVRGLSTTLTSAPRLARNRPRSPSAQPITATTLPSMLPSIRQALVQRRGTIMKGFDSKGSFWSAWPSFRVNSGSATTKDGSQVSWWPAERRRAHLEPDRKHGRGYLEAVRRGSGFCSSEARTS
jgi:hypothetical protein